MRASAVVVVAGVLALAGSGLVDRGPSQDGAAALPTPAAPSGAGATNAPPVIGCAKRAEPSPDRLDGRRDIVRGDAALVTVARDLPQLSRASYRPRAGRLAAIKLPVGVRAGHAATLAVAASDRRHAALIYRDATRNSRRIADGDAAVTFRACAADTPAFSGGTVGPITGWPGALIVSGPRCIRLRLSVDGERRADIRLPLGRRCR